MSAAPKKQMQETVNIDTRILDLRKIIEERAKELSFPISDAPSDYLSSNDTDTWQGREIWKLRFIAASPEHRCQQLEVLSALAIARVSSLLPSKQICSFSDFVCKDSKDALFQKDLRRLRWEFRYLQAIDEKDVPKNPPSCLQNLLEMKQRLEFASPSPKDRNYRWPLGRAIGMCARPMNAHYLDQSVMEGTRAEPKTWQFFEKLGWDEVLDLEETDLSSKP